MLKRLHFLFRRRQIVVLTPFCEDGVYLLWYQPIAIRSGFFKCMNASHIHGHEVFCCGRKPVPALLSGWRLGKIESFFDVKAIFELLYAGHQIRYRIEPLLMAKCLSKSIVNSVLKLEAAFHGFKNFERRRRPSHKRIEALFWFSRATNFDVAAAYRQ